MTASAIHGFAVEYIERHGHFMMLSRPEGLKQEELNAFQLKMVAANRIPRQLELQTESMNGDVRLVYNLTGRRMLSQRLRMEKLPLTRYFGLLHELADILDESKVYMLRAEGYVLHEDFIYCGSGLDDLYLTYVPLERRKGGESLAGELLQLASRLVRKVPELRGSGYQELMDYLQDETFHFGGMKQLLQRHIQILEKEEWGGPQEAPSGSFSAARSARPEGTERKRPAGEPPAFSSSFAHPSASAAAGSEWPAKEEASLPFLPDGPEATDTAGQRPKSKRTLFVAAGFVIGLALIWKLYADKPTEPMLYICSGLSLFVVLGAYLLLKLGSARDDDDDVDVSVGWRVEPLRDSAAEEPERVGEMLSRIGLMEVGLSSGSPGVRGRRSESDMPGPGSGDSDAFPSFEGRSADASTAHAVERRGAVPSSLHAAAPPSFAAAPTAYAVERRSAVPSSSAAAASSPFAEPSPPAATTLLAPPAATVLLKPLPEAERKGETPYLETTNNGQTEKIALRKSVFVFGRQEHEVDYALDDAGISRIHAEIVREDGSLALKDLGSRNGTSLNGETLVPYRPYPLQDGDVIAVARTEFVFKSGA